MTPSAGHSSWIRRMYGRLWSTAGRSAGAPRQAPSEESLEHQRMVVLRVLRRIHQRHRLSACCRKNRLPALRVSDELSLVAFAEHAPACRIVTEPFAQARARRHILEPAVDRHVLFADAPRPQPIDEKPHPLRAGGEVVDACD